jgi:ZIP family zinc transporter
MVLLEVSDIWLPLALSAIAGLSTTIGAFFALFTKKLRHMCLAMGFSAGVMIFVSFVELLGRGIQTIGYLPAVLFFFGGVLFIMVIDFIVPHIYQSEGSCESVNLKRMGLMVALGVFIHNLPEGVITMFSSITDLGLGVVIAFAVAIHNIPEGLAVACPIYNATKSKKKAFWYSFLSGIAEPIGAVLGIMFFWFFLTEWLLYGLLAAAAGIMVFISVDELLPFALRGANHHKIILGVFLGMLVMAISLIFA